LILLRVRFITNIIDKVGGSFSLTEGLIEHLWGNVTVFHANSTQTTLFARGHYR